MFPCKKKISISLSILPLTKKILQKRLTTNEIKTAEMNIFIFRSVRPTEKFKLQYAFIV